MDAVSAFMTGNYPRQPVTSLSFNIYINIINTYIYIYVIYIYIWYSPLKDSEK